MAQHAYSYGMGVNVSRALSGRTLEEAKARTAAVWELVQIKHMKAELSRGIISIMSNHTQTFTDKTGDAIRASASAGSSNVVIQIFNQKRRDEYVRRRPLPNPNEDSFENTFVNDTGDMAVALTFEQAREFIVQISRVYSATVVDRKDHTWRLADDMIRALGTIPNELDQPDAQSDT